jgi:hypothetical protein
VVLAVFAVVTAAFAIFAFYKQSREVDILIEQNERDIRDRHRNQASQVFIWAEAGSTQDQTVTGLIAHIKNTSNRPVYDGLLGYRNSYGHMENRFVFKVLMPDDQADTHNAFREPVPVPAFWQNNSRLQVSVRFRDAAGVFWVLDSDGQLKEMPALDRGTITSPGPGPGVRSSGRARRVAGLAKRLVGTGAAGDVLAGSGGLPVDGVVLVGGAADGDQAGGLAVG